MRGHFVAAACRAEIKRSRRDKRRPDLQYLADETELPEGVVGHIVWALEREGRFYAR